MIAKRGWCLVFCGWNCEFLKIFAEAKIRGATWPCLICCQGLRVPWSKSGILWDRWCSIEWRGLAMHARPASEGQECCSFSFFLYNILGFSSGLYLCTQEEVIYYYHEMIIHPSSFQSTISDSNDNSGGNWRTIILKCQQKKGEGLRSKLRRG